MRTLLMAGAILALVMTSPAMAGDEPGDHMAEMAKCHVCKVMLPHLGELMPVMKMETVTMDDGMAMISTISDPAKIGLYHETCDAMHKAGKETMAFTADEAKEKMCPMCYQMWDIMASGGHMSSGKTSDGNLMILTSDEEAVQAKITALQKQYESMSMGS